WSSGLIGHNADFFAISERLHKVQLEAGALRDAARSAFWAGFRSFALGERGRAAGWMSRAQRLADGIEGDCAVRGYLLLPVSHRHVETGNFEAAYAAAAEAAEIGERCQDSDLVAFARTLQGRNLLRMGKVDEGLALMDEAMLAATSGEIGPIMTGLIYCSLIAGCHSVFALDRAREWTDVLDRWWQSQPQLVAFTSTCMVHRAELLHLNGGWTRAMEEVQRAIQPPLRDVERMASADAYYQQAEVYRLRGEYERAEESYKNAHAFGREPQPGLALLRLYQGQSDAALHAVRRVLAATTGPLARLRYLPGLCEVAVATGALDDARAGCRELSELAQQLGGDVLAAMAGHAHAALRIAEGEPQAAVEPLRAALAVWQRLPAPYIEARLRVLLARACRALGDDEGASLELAAARKIFESLGAAPDLQRLDADGGSPPAAHKLSPRELQVLRLLASGKTNKQIARELGLSERTVDRHVSNILTKIDVSSRAAATAYAYEHRLL
ncbi:MAG TPA: LuxR C-terminal-related transcriptional regulator, partial [Polyangiales bacterium]|nr:LuxR C-terminal-related transcriptional regulator [Polyangiales bacterium]